MSKKHIQLPNNMTVESSLTPKDLLVYVNIKRHQNSITKEAFPSADTIAKESGISKPTVLKCIKKLVEADYLSIRKEGRKNVYSFNPYKKFEVFSEEFLDNQDIDASVKAYIIATQQILFKDVEGLGKTTYTNTELANIINMDRNAISKYDKLLENKGLLTMLTVKDASGVNVNEKIFHLNELGQAIIWKLKQHDDDIKNLKETTANTNRDVAIMLQEINRLKEEMKKLTSSDSIVC